MSARDRMWNNPWSCIWKKVDLALHHGGKFVRDPNLRYVGVVEELKKNVDLDTMTAARIEELSGENYSTKPTTCYFKNPIFSDFKVSMEELKNDDDARFLVSVAQDVNEVHLSFDHAVVDEPAPATEDEAMELQRQHEVELHEAEAEAGQQDEATEGEEPPEADSSNRDDDDDGSAEDSTYKMGPELFDFNVEADFEEFLNSTEPRLAEFDRSRAHDGQEHTDEQSHSQKGRRFQSPCELKMKYASDKSKSNST
ncbi:hypothetical protein CDL15_Pgr020862 [Punica granatum]|uniref:PB1-like domain-containing protein n=1 Tax=Punica granatum TaxID=22663 RepID=A0A218XVT8_PUNGR|nr:hypothetical protein CDL15_Pgr020862 [Punica granatum]PKI75944.1 hypothetical protein CRG98_003678 [Punica granatum]